MAYKIIWYSQANKDLERVLDYLDVEWPNNVAKEFLFQLQSRINLLATGIIGGRQATKNHNVFSIFITKHNRLYYEFFENELYIIALWDTRQFPFNNKYE